MTFLPELPSPSAASLITGLFLLFCFGVSPPYLHHASLHFVCSDGRRTFSAGRALTVSNDDTHSLVWYLLPALWRVSRDVASAMLFQRALTRRVDTNIAFPPYISPGPFRYFPLCHLALYYLFIPICLFMICGLVTGGGGCVTCGIYSYMPYAFVAFFYAMFVTCLYIPFAFALYRHCCACE